MIYKHFIKTLLIVLVILALTSSHSCHHHTQKQKKMGKSAICILHPQENSEVKGMITIHQESLLHPVYYQFTVGGLNINSYHGVHIHQFGDLTEGCKTAGPHYNPYHHTHGGPRDIIRHAGDLGNLPADWQGFSQICIADRVTTLYGDKSILGRSIVVHKNKDDLGKGGDLQSSKTGNAGPRIACGVIGIAEQFKHFSISNIFTSNNVK